MKSNPFLMVAMVLILGGSLRPTLAMAGHQEYLEGPLEDGPAVTRACLECHEESARDFMKTKHWTWSSLQDVVNMGPVNLGKKNAINNFCISVTSNWPRCTSCHAGYGWKDETFDFSDPVGVDCLVCHDQTGAYEKSPTGAGMPTPGLNLLKIARHVGKPTRRTCGSCHFFGGGGDAVKHGNLNTALVQPTRALDVHMGVDGQDFSCQDCHKTQRHRIRGGAMISSPGHENHLTCTDCHDPMPHGKSILDRHIHSVACQTCHIPAFAKVRPTNVWWDWSTAGQDHPVESDEYGLPTYDKKKGHLRWDANIVPTYAWTIDGKAGVYLTGHPIDPTRIVALNWPVSSKADAEAKITPFKMHRGKQPYDAENRYLMVPKLFGPGGFWETFDWNKAAELGMEKAGLPYSGKYGFVETVMYWRLNHGVVPAEESLKCNDCHAKEGGRMDWKALGYEGDPMRVKGIARMLKKE